MDESIIEFVKSIDMSWVLAGIFMLVILDSLIELGTPRHILVARERAKNFKRGLTMMPNFPYRDPYDDSLHISPTGRARDCSCGGTHILHNPAAMEASMNKPRSVRGRSIWKSYKKRKLRI